MKNRSTLKFLAMLLLLAQLFSLTAGITVFAAENETERDEFVDYTTEIPEGAELVALPVPYARYQAKVIGSVSMGGNNYEDGLEFYSGTGNGISEMSINLDGKFSAITFDTGYISGSDWDGTLTVLGDGVVLLDKMTMKSLDLPKTVTLNVEGVRQLKFYHEKPSNAYNDVRYGVCHLRGVLAEAYDDAVIVSDAFYDVPRYLMRGNLTTEPFEMGGKQYDAGYVFKTFGGDQERSVAFNFKKQYEKMSFDFGKCLFGRMYNEKTSVFLTVSVDGKVHPDYDKVELLWDGLPIHVELDLKGVTQVVVDVQGTSSWYQDDTSCIGNIQLKSNGKAQGILLDASPVGGTDDYTATLTDKAPTIALNPRVYPSDAPRDYEMKIAEGGEFITVEDDVVSAIHGGTAKIVYTLPNNKDVEVVCDITSKVTEHLWDEGEITKAPTLKENGEKLYHCTLCDKTKTEKLDKLVECEEHTWNDGEITKEPTYTEEGKALFTCTVCGKTEERVVEKLSCTDHKWDDGEVTKEPTYEAEGEKLFTCENCGETKTEPVEKLVCTKHKWDDGEVTKEPTYEAEGEKVFTCENCGETKTEPVEKLVCTKHKWDDGEVTKEPTYNAEGETLYTCTVCGETKTETIAKLIPENPFEDIGDNDWFRDPVLWAYANGITGGIAANLFGPHESCTRGQVVTFLWAAAGKPAPTSDYNP
ncbi:MAG: NPCBM/NEW2 domain-containing protein, partial [Oscillospiraceae bacterium]|nr:NPCBM/NEW2 domain-containing protein [Oscillospiraceae bacterium]